MTSGRARTLWTEQCGVTHSIKARYGLKAALDYLVSEKLLNFADAAASHPVFAQELPAFVAEVRRIFTPQEVAQHLTALEQDQKDAATAAANFDLDGDFGDEDQVMVAARMTRFENIKQLLVAGQLGTS